MGSFKNYEFEILSGTLVTNIYHQKCYWVIFLSVIFCIIIFGYLAVYIKKYSNRNKITKIHLRLEDQGSTESIFNNRFHNKPMLSSCEIAVLFPIVLCIVMIGCLTRK